MTAGYCGTTWSNNWKDGLCPGSTEANPIRPTVKPNGQGGIVGEPATADNNTVQDNAPWMADTSPVRVGYNETTYSGGIPSVSENPVTTVYEAMDDFRSLYTKAHVADAEESDVKAYQDLLSRMRDVTGSKLGTKDSQEQAYYSLLQYAARAGVNAVDLINGQAPGGGSDGSGGGRGYTGPRASITVQAESDIRATANALALEMIGRPLNDKEIERVTKRMRKAEQEQPQVTTGNVARTVTTQGLTAQGREDVLRDVIAKRPEFEQYQLDTTVMDAMNAYVQEKRQVVDV
jgi:hypothetical protein